MNEFSACSFLPSASYLIKNAAAVEVQAACRCSLHFLACQWRIYSWQSSTPIHDQHIKGTRQSFLFIWHGNHIWIMRWGYYGDCGDSFIWYRECSQCCARVMHASLLHACEQPRSTAKHCQYSPHKKASALSPSMQGYLNDTKILRLIPMLLYPLNILSSTCLKQFVPFKEVHVAISSTCACLTFNDGKQINNKRIITYQ